VPWTWIDATGDIAGQLVRQGRLADLIVVNRRLDAEPWPDMRAIAGQLIVAAEGAVVAVPDDARGFAVGGHALVAFDGSAEASAALRAAVPLLQLAARVTLVEIARGSTAGAVEEAATYLSRHGVHPAIVGWHPGADEVGDILLAEIGAQKADYVVMGGFGHSRMVEALFGGVSRQMLGESPVPLVIAH
jgi:nucleotide-binding universal stress UspA family protein